MEQHKPNVQFIESFQYYILLHFIWNKNIKLKLYLKESYLEVWNQGLIEVKIKNSMTKIQGLIYLICRAACDSNIFKTSNIAFHASHTFLTISNYFGQKC